MENLQARIGYAFRRRELLEQALTHSSLAYERSHGERSQGERSHGERSQGQQQDRPQGHSTQDDNEQLEFLGDAVLGLVVTEHLYRTYPDLNEGDLTQLRAQLVSRKHLGRIARTLQLGEALRLGKGEERNGGRRKAALLSNALEALIAAMYLDGGLEPAGEFVRVHLLAGTLEEMVEASRAGLAVGDHKSALQEYFQARNLGQPRYAMTSESGPDHQKTFVVALEMKQPDGESRQLACASGSRKKNAEQEAARLALVVLLAEPPHKKEVHRKEAGNGAGKEAGTVAQESRG